MSPAGQFLNTVLNKKTNLPNQMSYAILCRQVKQPGVFAICSPVRGNRQIAVEIETGKSNIKANLDKIEDAGFDRIVFVATSATAVSACQRAIEAVGYSDSDTTELLTWLDIS